MWLLGLTQYGHISAQRLNCLESRRTIKIDIMSSTRGSFDVHSVLSSDSPKPVQFLEGKQAHIGMKK